MQLTRAFTASPVGFDSDVATHASESLTLKSQIERLVFAPFCLCLVVITIIMHIISEATLGHPISLPTSN